MSSTPLSSTWQVKSKTPCQQPWAIAVGSVREDTGERLVATQAVAQMKTDKTFLIAKPMRKVLSVFLPRQRNPEKPPSAGHDVGDRVRVRGRLEITDCLIRLRIL